MLLSCLSLRAGVPAGQQPAGWGLPPSPWAGPEQGVPGTSERGAALWATRDRRRLAWVSVLRPRGNSPAYLTLGLPPGRQRERGFLPCSRTLGLGRVRQAEVRQRESQARQSRSGAGVDTAGALGWSASLGTVTLLALDDAPGRAETTGTLSPGRTSIRPQSSWAQLGVEEAAAESSGVTVSHFPETQSVVSRMGTVTACLHGCLQASADVQHTAWVGACYVLPLHTNTWTLYSCPPKSRMGLAVS